MLRGAPSHPSAAFSVPSVSPSRRGCWSSSWGPGLRNDPSVGRVGAVGGRHDRPPVPPAREVSMLPPAKDDLLRRRWIRQALSDLFLDEEITEDTLYHIARITAECEYTDEELEAIYRHEVAPAV